jgi:WD40 repeat protein
METGEIMQTFDGHGDGILAIDFNPEETQMVTGAFDNRMIVWDINTGEIVRQFEGHSDRVSAVAINPFNSRQVASASNDRTMKLWDLETGFEIFTYEGHTERVIDVHFSVDGESILTASTDNSLILWRQPQQLDELLSWMRENRHVRELTCLEREQYLATENACDTETTTDDSPNL